MGSKEVAFYPLNDNTAVMISETGEASQAKALLCM